MKRPNLPEKLPTSFWMVILVVLVFGGSFLWQKQSDEKQQELDSQENQIYIAPAAEFTVVTPKDWKIENAPNQEDGLVKLNIEGPSNKFIDDELSRLEREGLEGDTVDLLTDDEVLKLFETNVVAQQYAFATLDAILAPYYELPASAKERRVELENSGTTANGVSFSNFEDFEIEGAKGFSYRTTTVQGNTKVGTINYYILGATAEIEISLFPAISAQAEVFDEIVKDIVVADESLLDVILDEES